MTNERITENIVREKLRVLEYYNNENDIRVEEQKSEIEAVKKLLQKASKTGGKGKGAPEFIISSASTPDFLIIIECKADVRNHESGRRNQPVQYAVDGVLHYGKNLCKEFNIIAIAVSGESSSEIRISSFVFTKGDIKYRELINQNNQPIRTLLSWDEFISNATYNPTIQRIRYDELMACARELHDFMRDYAKLTESEKPLLVSGTLIALKDKVFAKGFGDYSPDDLQKQWLHVIKTEIERAEIPNAKKQNMVQPYSSISTHPELGRPSGKTALKYPRGVLYELIRMLKEKVWPFINEYHDFDIVGQFYGEFLKYTGGDKKSLGIVLTPRHITELFADLANVQKSSKILDICAGTGGFLIAAMHKMMKQTETDEERKLIKREGLIGVEQQPNMYALAASNMILRGDGKANLYQGSCFDEAITEGIKKHKCNIGMINPPYSQGDSDLHELVFVKHLLDCLSEETNSIGIAIVPMSCAITPNPLRDELLNFHTLEAVMSMPDELFYPVGTVTCIMVFTAHIPHATSNRKTWFGYWKHDGFVKTKHNGRIDINRQWNEIKNQWVSSFRNRDEIVGQSIKKQVDSSDEWCAEAYMETDYSLLKEQDFELALKNYFIFRALGSNGLELSRDFKENLDE
ncbi:MAG: N-6 DNA methylase [Candidatus Atribacteria bacterium]|nr:N-6 DNA methylase [Candidatus Atribacteria bacterium]